jgi:hypothetical protein
MDEKDALRTEVEDADDTGLVAGEEQITAALISEKLHGALPQGHAAHVTVDDLHAEMSRSSPDRRSIDEHVSRLRALPELEAIVANLWDDPRTQRFISNLNQIGL